MNLSFAGCGFLGLYHVGVASCFREYAPQVLVEKIAGASAGALAACCLICNVPLGESTTDVLKIAVKARARALGPFHPGFDINNILHDGLTNMFPEDAHIRCKGRLHISVTRVSDGENVLLTQFDSKEDLIQALLCSCFIPFYTGILPPKFHGVAYMDGAFSNNLPVLNENTITVSPFSGESDICPQDNNFSIMQISLANTNIA
ncbi:patatin-like phospholipase domain-containing protein 2, partial [Limulus polyphemus]|uniref:Patatin-like phospholipase domain-containing protein 2 n=1 Tax=Limulus polyphemus TaxID=6850 RepID=A0ABM1BSG0_LIMPO